MFLCFPCLVIIFLLHLFIDFDFCPLQTPEEAKQAVETCVDKAIGGSKIVCGLSQDVTKFRLKNLPFGWTLDEFTEAVKEKILNLKGFLSIELQADKVNPAR